MTVPAALLAFGIAAGDDTLIYAGFLAAAAMVVLLWVHSLALYRAATRCGARTLLKAAVTLPLMWAAMAFVAGMVAGLATAGLVAIIRLVETEGGGR